MKITIYPTEGRSPQVIYGATTYELLDNRILALTYKGRDHYYNLAYVYRWVVE